MPALISFLSPSWVGPRVGLKNLFVTMKKASFNGLEGSLADFAEEVAAQRGNLGSFQELLKTVDPKQTVAEFGRRFLVDRILVAAGTPKSIVDRLEELHFETGANGGFILGRGYSSENIREFVDHVVPELQRRGLSKTEYAGPTLRENLNA